MSTHAPHLHALRHTQSISSGRETLYGILRNSTVRFLGRVQEIRTFYFRVGTRNGRIMISEI